MDTTLQNKVAVISGSSQGIGKAIARELGKHGAGIVINGRDRSKLLRVKEEFNKEGIEVTPIVADIRISQQCQYLIEQAISKYGRFDILVNNAGVSSRGAVEAMADPIFKIVMDTNYLGAAYLSKFAIPYLKKSRGSLIFINSVGGFRGMPYNSAYTASKMALFALSQALEVELKDDHIHVGTVFVGFTENDPGKKILDVDGSWIYLPKRTNIRLAKPTSVAKSVYKMITQRKSKITLTGLGHFTEFMNQYFPILSGMIIHRNLNKIKNQFTLIGGEKVGNESPTRLHRKRFLTVEDI